MSVLTVTENIDLFFKKRWDINVQRLVAGGGYSMATFDRIRESLYGLCESDEWWDIAFGQSCAAHWVYGRGVPRKYWNQVNELNKKLTEYLHRIDPSIKYIKIVYDTMIQGNFYHLPNIRLYIGDHKPSPNADVPLKINICYNHTNYEGFYGSKKDAGPKPKFADFFPDWNEFKGPERSWPNNTYEFSF